jgi:hypothetical protein
VFIELAEVLDCPTCSDGFGLVAFVAESESRRVTSGSLGCPMCEIELPIVGGAIDLGAGAEPKPITAPADEMALRISALLGLAERGGSAILLGSGLGEYAPRVAQMAGRVEVLAVVPRGTEWPLDDLASGVNPLFGLTDRWPIRTAKLDGVALRGAVGDALQEAVRCLAVERRLVLFEPDPADLDRVSDAGFETLAGDERTWVGTRV